MTVGILMALGGYTLFFYGLNVITGGNDPFLSVFWPGRYKVTPRDGAS